MLLLSVHRFLALLLMARVHGVNSRSNKTLSYSASSVLCLTGHVLLLCRPLYSKLKSVSTGDLLDSTSNADWLLDCTSSDSMERRVLLGVSTVPAEDYHFTVRTSLSKFMSTSYRKTQSNLLHVN